MLKDRCYLWIWLVCVSGAVLLTGAACADEIYLKNGDRLTGKILEDGAEVLRVKADLLGELRLSRKDIERIAQGSAPAQVKPVEAPRKALENMLSLSYVNINGNSRSTKASAGLDARYRKGAQEWAIKSEWVYGSDSGKMTTQKFFAKAQSDRFFDEDTKWFLTRAVEVSHDRFNNVDYRLLPSAGVGYRFWDREDSRALADVALGYEYTDYRQDAKNEGSLVVVPHALWSKTLFWGIKAAQDVTVYPSLEEAGDYRLRSVSSLIYPLNRVWNWKLSLTDDFNSAPKGNAKKNDSTFMASLGYMF